MKLWLQYGEVSFFFVTQNDSLKSPSKIPPPLGISLYSHPKLSSPRGRYKVKLSIAQATSRPRIRVTITCSSFALQSAGFALCIVGVSHFIRKVNCVKNNNKNFELRRQKAGVILVFLRFEATHRST